MDTNMSRRGALTMIAGGLATVAALPTEGTSAASSSPGPDFAAVLRWEEALAAADKQGERWVEEARILKAFLITAAAQAEDVGLPAVAASLRPQIAEADKTYQEREELFAHWAHQAWSLPDLGLVPPRPWA